MQYHWRHSVVWQIQNMETLKARPLMLLVVVLILGVLGVWEVKMASAGPSDAQCKEERRIGVNACKPVLYGKLPSAECCQRVRVTHIECVCRDITPNMAALIDLNRAVRLVEGCGRRVPRHYKCGSITTP